MAYANKALATTTLDPIYAPLRSLESGGNRSEWEIIAAVSPWHEQNARDLGFLPPWWDDAHKK